MLFSRLLNPHLLQILSFSLKARIASIISTHTRRRHPDSPLPLRIPAVSA